MTLAYTRALGGATEFSGGLVYYGNRGAPDTTEVYASVSREMPLNPSITFNYDVDEGDGALALLSISHDLPLLADLSVSFSAAASYNINHKVMGTLADGEPFAGLYHAELGLSLAGALGRRVTLAPRILWTFPLTDKARQAMEGASYDGRTSTLVSGGIGVVIEF
jgi:hypothetical protein